jgi:hypothetical protein
MSDSRKESNDNAQQNDENRYAVIRSRNPPAPSEDLEQDYTINTPDWNTIQPVQDSNIQTVAFRSAMDPVFRGMKT